MKEILKNSGQYFQTKKSTKTANVGNNLRGRIQFRFLFNEVRPKVKL